jgi:hypothetical protein
VGAGVRASEGDVDGAVAAHAVELLHRQLVLLDGLVQQRQRVLVDLRLLGSVTHLLLDLLQLSAPPCTSW